ncbi:class I SAM-dependent methyltransferase [Burkholderiaceae bacterium UC74_6]
MQALLHAIAQMAFAPERADAYRVFHGRGGLHPGCEHWTLDFYPPVFLLTSFQPVSDDELARVDEALTTRWQELHPDQALNLVFQCRQEGGRTETRLTRGEAPEPHEVTESGTRYLVHLLRGQNHGLFLDMAQGRRWLAEQVAARVAAGAAPKILNLFAYTCAFSVGALKAGAAQVVNVDMSSGALSVGQRNHRLNGITNGASFFAHDVFNSWGKLKRLGPYDFVVLDPPAHQKGSFVATKDYARLMRKLPELLAPGGQALLCLNTPKLDVAFLQDQMRELAPDLQFERRLPNPPAFADVSEERSLKVLVYRQTSEHMPDQTPDHTPNGSGAAA